MDKGKHSSAYQKLKGIKIESYAPVITMPLEEWKNYVSNGENTLYGDAIIPSGTMDDGAVYTGHVRQNAFTAGVGLF